MHIMFHHTHLIQGPVTVNKIKGGSRGVNYQLQKRMTSQNIKITLMGKAYQEIQFVYTHSTFKLVR